MYIQIEQGIDKDLLERTMFLPLSEPYCIESAFDGGVLRTAPVRHVHGPIKNWILETNPDGTKYLHTSISLLSGPASLTVQKIFDKLVHQGFLEYSDLVRLAGQFGNEGFEQIQKIKRMAASLGIYYPSLASVDLYDCSGNENLRRTLA